MSGRFDLSGTVPSVCAAELAELVAVCPSCFGVSLDIALARCPDCDEGLLVRSPVGSRRAPVAAALPLGVG